MGPPAPGDEPTPPVGEGPTRGTGRGGTRGPIAATVGEAQPAPGGDPPGAPRRGRVKERLGDRVFRRGSLGSAVFLLVLLVAIALFLLARALPAINTDTTSRGFPTPARRCSGSRR